MEYLNIIPKDLSLHYKTQQFCIMKYCVLTFGPIRSYLSTYRHILYTMHRTIFTLHIIN